MYFLGRFIKTILRSLFSIIVFLLLVGVSKMNWDIREYISFLNTTDWGVFRWSQPSTWVAPFWPHSQNISLDDLLLDDAVTTGSFGSNGIDPYDPLFEQDLNAIIDDSFSGDEVEYGFTQEGQSTGIYKSTNTSSLQLLKLIKHRELTK